MARFTITATLSAHVQGDAALAQELAELFLADYPERLSELHDAITDKEESMTPPSTPRRETILLAEDYAPVRRVIRRTLELQGYTLLEARNGHEAVRVAEQYREPIHLLLSDVVMPSMNGFVLADRLAPLHPETNVLYLSGYADALVGVRGGLKEAGRPFLLKPFTQKELMEKIGAALVGTESTP